MARPHTLETIPHPVQPQQLWLVYIMYLSNDTAPITQHYTAPDEKTEQNTVCIRIEVTGGQYERTLPRSLIRTSTILISNRHQADIYLNWSGTVDVFDIYAAWMSAR
jgi:hypothetical protein